MYIYKQLTIQSSYYKQILSYLNSTGGVARLVGGCVRDAILGKPNFDIDINTTLLPEQVMSVLSTKNNIKIVPTGVAFGTISAFIDNERFEITTLRQDLSCDGRRAKVVFTTDFGQDAARRDFTINALSYCPFTETIYDYFNGIQDISAKKVIFIGMPQQRIQEDYLRILRFFRFSCDYAKQIDPDGLKACAELKHKLSTLSFERIKAEIDRLIDSNNAPTILQQMNNKNILPYIFPWAWDHDALAKGKDFAKNIGIKLTRSIQYSILFHTEISLTSQQLLNFKFSKHDSEKILNILKLIQESKHLPIYSMLKKLWQDFDNYPEYITAVIATSYSNSEIAKEFIAKHINTTKPLFPITGNDLLKIGLHGKVLGAMLSKLKSLWMDSDFTITKQQLLDIACDERVVVSLK
ncbi:CCA tRNA nucleotidyltransferase [Candidatus Trichorickettsia mobilis]|uniref:CCA tRNA nucleotidyltransferase n=1 Tax=Candidatus Trichorickettsia mobilis TaxID=1346319 RepID=UPI00292DEF08|nr:CCA tRNA nucleotidyltransferase [Candidatus Trichorickettsia mobilis]